MPPAEWQAMGSIPRRGRSPGGGHGNPLQCSCLENPMDREAWPATVHWVAKSQTWLKWLSSCSIFPIRMSAPWKQISCLSWSPYSQKIGCTECSTSNWIILQLPASKMDPSDSWPLVVSMPLGPTPFPHCFRADCNMTFKCKPWKTLQFASSSRITHSRGR